MPPFPFPKPPFPKPPFPKPKPGKGGGWYGAPWGGGWNGYNYNAYPTTVEIVQPDGMTEKILRFIASLQPAQRAAAFEHFFGKRYPGAMGADCITDPVTGKPKPPPGFTECGTGTAVGPGKQQWYEHIPGVGTWFTPVQAAMVYGGAAAAIYFLFIKK